MIRTNHIFAACLGLGLVMFVCLAMAALRCGGCTLHSLSLLAASVLVAALLLGVALWAATLWSTRRMWRACRLHAVPHSSTLQQVQRSLGLPARRIICVEQSEAFAFCLGLLHPRIVVSTGLLRRVSPRELAAILAHERRHQQRRDPLRLLVMRCLRWMLFPVPAVHDFYRTFAILLEIEADEAAIAQHGRPVLAGALHTLLSSSQSAQVGSRSAAMTRFTVSNSRIEHLLDPQRTVRLPLSRLRLVISLLPFLLLCLSMFVG